MIISGEWWLKLKKVLNRGLGGLRPPEAEVFLVFECENVTSPEKNTSNDSVDPLGPPVDLFFFI